MSKYKDLLAGLIIGSIVATAGTAFANPTLVPSITSWVKFKFNGVDKDLPQGYTVLNYQGHTYVPARFVAEELNAEVDWSEEAKTVLITSMDESKSTTLPTKETKYSLIPLSSTIDGVNLEVYSVEQNKDYTKIYINIKNTTKKLIQLNQDSSYFQSELATYENKDIEGTISFWKDGTWYTDIGEDEKASGYIMLPRIPDDEQQGKFYIELLENGVTPKITLYSFNIKW